MAKETLEETVRAQIEAMVDDQFYHQPGPIIHIHRDELVDMLTKQTLHGMEVARP
jgi:hypothetical protein